MSELAARNEQQNYLDQQLDETLEESRESRPKNTTSCYVPKQEEFMRWCDKRFTSSVPFRYIVNEASLLAFLKEEVVGRSSKISRTEKEIGEASINQYVNALTDLYKVQVSKGYNNFPPPRKGAVFRGFIDTIKRDKVNRKKRNFDDRGQLQIRQNILTDAELKRIEEYHYSKKNWRGVRDYMGSCTMRSLAMRGEHLRMLELPDLFLHEMKNEGDGCFAIVAVLNQGKTNQFGHIEVGGSIRSKDVSFCTHGSLAQWFYCRLDMLGEFPCMDNSEDWYNVKLFPAQLGAEQVVEMSGATHYNIAKKMLRKCHIDHMKATHLWRGDTARVIQILGVPHDERLRAGRWKHGTGGSSLENSYAMDLPESALRAIAGFSPDFRNVFIKRDQLEVPVSLLLQVFPGIDTILHEEQEKEQKNLAKIQFLKLLQYLRKVLIQDACFLSEKYPYHPMWQSQLFQSQDFIDYKNQMTQFVENMVDPTETKLKELLPHAFEKLNSDIAAMNNKLIALQHSIDDLRSKRRQISVSIGEGALEVVDSENRGRTVATSGQQDVPVYRMARTNNVSRLWEEWSVGLNGMPSIKHLEENKVRWRTSSAEKMYYSRRKKVISCIERCSQIKRIFLEDSAALIEQYRCSNKRTIDWMSKNIQKVYEEFRGLGFNTIQIHKAGGNKLNIFTIRAVVVVDRATLS